jgi:hypothetical protein
MLPVASEKSNGNVMVGLVLLHYREVQYVFSTFGQAFILIFLFQARL